MKIMEIGRIPVARATCPNCSSVFNCRESDLTRVAASTLKSVSCPVCGAVVARVEKFIATDFEDGDADAVRHVRPAPGALAAALRRTDDEDDRLSTLEEQVRQLQAELIMLQQRVAQRAQRQPAPAPVPLPSQPDSIFPPTSRRVEDEQPGIPETVVRPEGTRA